MATFAFVMPVLPGKEDVDRETMQRFSSGEESGAFAAAFKSKGITRHAVWHQATPDGTLAIVVFEGDDIESAIGAMATSDEPFDKRFRAFLEDVHGVDIATSPPPDVRPVIDCRF
jgi:hypothetical protein